MTLLGRRAVIAGGGAALAGLAVRRARSQAQTIRIGLMAPLSGTLAIVGNPVLLGAQIAVDQINRAGGLIGKTVELVVADDKADPNQSVASAKELLGQNVNLIVGEPLTANALALSPVLKDQNGVLAICGTSDERITEELFIRNWFTIAPNNHTAGAALAQVLAQRFPDIPTWTALVADNSNGHNFWLSISNVLPEVFARVAKKQVTMVGPSVSKTGQADLKALIANMIASGATGVITQSPGSGGVTFYQQARQLNLEGTIKVFGDYGLDIDLPNALKKNLPANCWSKSYYQYPAWAHNKLSQEVAKVHAERTNGSTTHQLACLGHTAVMGFAAAIKASGSNASDQVIAALEGLKFDSMRDQVYYRKEDHRMVSSLNVSHLVGRDGEPGWEYQDVQTIPDTENLQPPSPGKKREL